MMSGHAHRLFRLTLAGFLLFAGTASGIETRDSETICPACGGNQRVVVAVFSVHDRCLDGEPMWIDGRHGIWPSTLCDACRCPLVIDAYGKRFAALLETDAAALARTRDWLRREEYAEAARTFPSCFLLATILEHLDADPRLAGDLYLHATWQSPHDDPRTREALTRSLRCYEACLRKPTPPAEHVAFLAGEIDRRLGNFTAARRRLEALNRATTHSEDLRRIIAYELHLVAVGDSASHLLSSARDWWAPQQDGSR